MYKKSWKLSGSPQNETGSRQKSIRKFKNFLELNGNENTTYSNSNLWNIMKAGLRGKQIHSAKCLHKINRGMKHN